MPHAQTATYDFERFLEQSPRLVRLGEFVANDPFDR